VKFVFQEAVVINSTKILGVKSLKKSGGGGGAPKKKKEERRRRRRRKASCNQSCLVLLFK
jgi:hypothetical protein